MSNEIALQEYDKACKALEQAVYVDEAKAIRDEALSRAAYARQAKNRKLEEWAWRIRIRAEQRIGEMMENGKDDRAPVGRPKKLVPGGTNFPKPTLVASGIDQKLADRCRKLYKFSKTDDWGEFLTSGAKQNERHAEILAQSKARPKRPKPSKPTREYQCPHCGKPVYLKDGRLEK